MFRPMAITVIGGLLTSTFLTLLVVPVMYSLLDRKKDEQVTSRDDEHLASRDSTGVHAGTQPAKS